MGIPFRQKDRRPRFDPLPALRAFEDSNALFHHEDMMTFHSVGTVPHFLGVPVSRRDEAEGQIPEGPFVGGCNVIHK